MVEAEDALGLYQRLLAHGIDVWLVGGWGIDALLGEQTRPHKDLDVLLTVDALTLLGEVLGREGFVLKEIWSENEWLVGADQVPQATAFVLTTASGLELDVHALRLDEHGNGLPAWNARGRFFRAEDLAGEGSINGVAVRCVTAAIQLAHHTGYELPEAHQRDVQLLRERFGIA